MDIDLKDRKQSAAEEEFSLDVYWNEGRGAASATRQIMRLYCTSSTLRKMGEDEGADRKGLLSVGDIKESENAFPSLLPHLADSSAVWQQWGTIRVTL